MARRFVMCRKRNMKGLIKIWQAAAIKARIRLTKREERQHKVDRARMDRAIRLLRKGAISRAWKSLESKGLGNLRSPEILRQMRDKHPVRVEEIGPDMYTFVPEEPGVL